MTLQIPAEQSAIDRKIVDEMFAITPEDWKSILLAVEPRKNLDGGGVAITLCNPDVAGEEVEPTEEMRAYVGEMVTFLEREKRAWERLSYTAFVDPQGAWRLKIVVPLPD